MNYLIAFIFAAAGIACFIWYKVLYRNLANFYARQFGRHYGRLANFLGWDNPGNRLNLLIYKSGIVFLGLFFLAMAFHFAFGTIYIG